jgi:hypothetical protein
MAALSPAPLGRTDWERCAAIASGRLHLNEAEWACRIPGELPFGVSVLEVVAAADRKFELRFPWVR